MAHIQVLEILEAAAGGALRHLVQIAEHLDKDEFDLTLAVSPDRMARPERDIEQLRGLGARVELVPMRRRPAPVADLLAYRHLARLIREGRFDVVHAHSSKAGFLGRLAARQTGVPRTFYTPHAFAFQCGGGAGWLYRQLERAAARFGGTIVAVSESEKELAVRHGIAPADRIRVIRNAIPPPPEPTPDERAAARAALGLPSDALVVGTVGRLERQKGCVDLLRAAEHVVREQSDARLVLIGPGTLEGPLTELAKMLRISDQVTLTGHCDDPAGLYAAMDLYVQPSLWEGLPYAVLDAMGRGLPVVATDVPGNTDLVKDRATGLLVPPGEPANLADAIIGLLRDEGQRRALGRAGRELVLRDHRLDDFVRSIEALYRGDQ